MEMEFPNLKKHKKHKKERENYEEKSHGLKLILKVGSSGTPEHNAHNLEEYSYQEELDHKMHKKRKKKKKKKDKKEKKHKHHHHHYYRKEKEKEKKKKVKLEYIDEDSGSSPSQRELRTCVLRQRQERSPLQRMLDHLLKAIEKRDPNQFFAWPVTDNIAPGYSTIITNPMDLSTMKQKIDDNLYSDLQEFVADFRLMCTNAMEYNHIDTIYYKTSKKLLQSGLKLFQPEKVGWILQLIPELTDKDFGFEIPPDLRLNTNTESMDSFEVNVNSSRKRKMPMSKFEAIPDDLEPEEILQRARRASEEVRAKLAAKGGGPSMGFLRQREDGTTNLNILVGGDGTIPNTKKRPVLLGTLTGKLSEGTGQIQGFREDRRNLIKPVKPLYYGPFGSYAPSYDSAFSNLTKDESELIYRTYGSSETGIQYAESLIDFTKDSNYASYLADSLLDLFTGNEHSKTKRILDEKKKLKEEEEAVKIVLETPQKTSNLININIKLDDLRSLEKDGINMEFLNEMESEIKSLESQQELQKNLDSMSQLLDKLHKIQFERLSMPLPGHLSQIQNISEEEMNLAESITENLTEIAKKVNPGELISVPGVRKALGVSVDNEVSELEMELRQYLENESNLKTDNSLEDILME